MVGPGKSASGKPILANDPHLGHGLPAIWYQAHLKTRTQEVIGVTVPGLPLIVIGHNRQIAWGFTNVMQDAADFFVEKLSPEKADQVMFKNQWVHARRPAGDDPVKGGPPVTLTIRSTPHGPLVSDLLPEEKQALAYRWTYFAAEEASELDGFLRPGPGRQLGPVPRCPLPLRSRRAERRLRRPGWSHRHADRRRLPAARGPHRGDALSQGLGRQRGVGRLPRF